MDRTEFIVALIVLGMLAVLAVGGHWGYSVARRSAVRAGAARWIANENGKPEFQWIVPEKEE